jgi:hypothetical protein
MNRHSEMVTTGAVLIETYVEGNGAVILIPSYGPSRVVSHGPRPHDRSRP